MPCVRMHCLFPTSSTIIVVPAEILCLALLLRAHLHCNRSITGHKVSTGVQNLWLYGNNKQCILTQVIIYREHVAKK